MNIFVLDLDPVKCAKYHVNKHVTKMCVEYAQLLCSAHYLTDSRHTPPYRLTHKNHPCSIWVRESLENYVWLTDLGLSLCKEYTHRYGKRHKSQDVIEWCATHLPKLKETGRLTPFALAMPDEYKVLGNGVQSYRNYYVGAKINLADWLNRNKPKWFN